MGDTQRASANSRVGWSKRHKKKAESRSHEIVEGLRKRKLWCGKVIYSSSRNHSWLWNEKSRGRNRDGRAEHWTWEAIRVAVGCLELLSDERSYCPVLALTMTYVRFSVRPGCEAAQLVLGLPSLYRVPSYCIHVYFSERTWNTACTSHWCQ